MDFSRALPALRNAFNQGINNAGENAYNAAQAIHDGLANLGAVKTQDEIDHAADQQRWGHYPAYMHVSPDKKNFNEVSKVRYQLGAFDPATLPKTLGSIQSYRADPTGRWGGKDGLETRPVEFDPKYQMMNGGSPAQLYSFARTLTRAHGGKSPLSAQDLTAMALKEGRADYGYLNYDTNNKSNVALVGKLMQQGLPETASKFAAAVSDKLAVSKRLGIPFAEAWNGTGQSKVSGSTGAQYAKNFEAFQAAAKHPRNKALVDFIQSAIDAEKPQPKKAPPPPPPTAIDNGVLPTIASYVHPLAQALGFQ